MHLKFKLRPETLFLCFQLIDRFLQASFAARMFAPQAHRHVRTHGTAWMDFWAARRKRGRDRERLVRCQVGATMMRLPPAPPAPGRARVNAHPI